MKKVIFISLIVIAFLSGFFLQKHISSNKISPEFPSMRSPAEMLKEYVDDPDSPIKYNAEFDEYYIYYETTKNGKNIERSILMRYCPISGAKLPSRRDEFFTKPTKKEVKDIFRLIRNVNTLQDAERILGKPDNVLYPPAGEIEVIYLYGNLSETVDLQIQKKKSGELEKICSPKQLK